MELARPPPSQPGRRLLADDFTLRLNPDSGTVRLMAPLFIDVVPKSQTGRPVTVALSASDLPDGIAVRFEPPSVVTGNVSVARFTASPRWARPGTYDIAIVGTGNGQTESVPFTLTVIRH